MSTIGTAAPVESRTPTDVESGTATEPDGSDLGAATRTALRDIAPCVAAIVPFGLAVGSASAAAGLNGFEAIFGAAIMLAGSGQLVAVQTIGGGEGIVAAAVIVGLVNMRFVFYGAAVARWFDGAGRLRRLLLVYPIVDQTFMLCQQRFEHELDPAWRQRYYLTVTAFLGGTFVGCQGISHLLGTHVPEWLGLHLAAPLAFAGLLANSLRSRGEVIAGSVAAIAVVAGAALLGPAAIASGALVGAVAGCTATRRAETVTP